MLKYPNYWSRNSPKNAIILCILVVIFGIFLRSINLEQKPYWLDESYTLLRSSSYTAQIARENLFNHQITSPEDILRYQHPSAQDKGARGTVLGLIQEEPQHPPLYFLLTRSWAKLFGHSQSATRALPVICSLLAFPAIYWLCLELFASPLVGWLAMALVAVSPIQLRYAQEVRQYSLWTTLILFSCVALFRAIRQPTKLNWGIYSLVILTGIYCHLLMGLVVIAHGIYILLTEKFRLTKTVLFHLISSSVAITATLPWWWVVWQNRTIVSQTTEHSTHPLPFSLLVEFWSVSLDRTFAAWHFNANPLFIYLTIPIIFLILYSFYFLCCHTSWKTWLFFLVLIGTIFLPFLIPDLLWGGRRSTYERYFLICFVSLDLVVAYLLASKLTQRFQSNLQSYFWRFLTLCIISVGIVSSIGGAFSATWWGWSEFDVEIAKITNSFPQPLIISDVPFGQITPFCHEVKPNTRFILLSEPESLQIPPEFNSIFLYNPSDRLLSTITQRNFKSDLIYQFKDSMTKLVVSLYQIKAPGKN